MKTYDYLIFVASINENMKLAKSMEETLVRLGKTSKIIDIVNERLPLYSSDIEENEGIPQRIIKSVEEMKISKGYIVIAPEYNYSIPPTLTNFIAWVSRVGSDFRVCFQEKPVLLATSSGGGGEDVLNAMRVQFTKLGSLVMPRQIRATYEKKPSQETLIKTIKQLIYFSV